MTSKMENDVCLIGLSGRQCKEVFSLGLGGGCGMVGRQHGSPGQRGGRTGAAVLVNVSGADLGKRETAALISSIGLFLLLMWVACSEVPPNSMGRRAGLSALGPLGCVPGCWGPATAWSAPPAFWPGSAPRPWTTTPCSSRASPASWPGRAPWPWASLCRCPRSGTRRPPTSAARSTCWSGRVLLARFVGGAECRVLKPSSKRHSARARIVSPPIDLCPCARARARACPCTCLCPRAHACAHAHARVIPPQPPTCTSSGRGDCGAGTVVSGQGPASRPGP